MREYFIQGKIRTVSGLDGWRVGFNEFHGNFKFDSTSEGRGKLAYTIPPIGLRHRWVGLAVAEEVSESQRQLAIRLGDRFFYKSIDERVDLANLYGEYCNEEDVLIISRPEQKKQYNSRMSQKIENGSQSCVFTINNGKGGIVTGDMCVLPDKRDVSILNGMATLGEKSAKVRVRKTVTDEYSNPSISVVFYKRGRGNRAVGFDGYCNNGNRYLHELVLAGEGGSSIRFVGLDMDEEIVK